MTMLPAIALIYWAPGWPAAWAILGFLTLQRLGELAYARRNTARLLARGAVEHGRRHYPAMVAIHTAFLIVLWASVAPDQPMIGVFVAAFVVLQLARLWVLVTLGPYWTTRIISSPEFPRITKGPYRLVRHPNYWVVSLEIIVIPLMFGLFWVAAVWSILNAIILTIRIRAENAVLSERAVQKPVA